MGLQGVSRAGGAGQGISLIITPNAPFKKPDDALPVPLGNSEGFVGLGWGRERQADFGEPACLNEAETEESERTYRRLISRFERQRSRALKRYSKTG